MTLEQQQKLSLQLSQGLVQIQTQVDSSSSNDNNVGYQEGQMPIHAVSPVDS